MTKAIGANGYGEIALKKLRLAEAPVRPRRRRGAIADCERETYFYHMSRGYYDHGGMKRWTKFVTIPASPEFA